MPPRSFSYVTADVFTNQRFGGNQLAVFPDASQLPEELMGPIAREFNFSETTFVLPATNPAHAKRVRIFTPTRELPFAGHPTVGTAFALASLGEIALTGSETRIVLEEGVGPVSVLIRSSEGRPDFAQLTAAQLPQVGPPPPHPRDLARVAGLEEHDIVTGTFAPEAVSCGLFFLMVRVRDRRTLARARPRLDEFARVFKGYVTDMVFLFCDEPELPGSHYRARMFAPDAGVPEDPATGSACAGFAGYLAARDKRSDGTLRWVVEQGFEMGRPSLLELEADKRDGAITAIRVGGRSVLVSRGEFFV
jgi:trans-2,3-dihydro-3-hydroxyanthranilate isomerase